MHQRRGGARVDIYCIVVGVVLSILASKSRAANVHHFPFQIQGRLTHHYQNIFGYHDRITAFSTDCTSSIRGGKSPGTIRIGYTHPSSACLSVRGGSAVSDDDEVDSGSADAGSDEDDLDEMDDGLFDMDDADFDAMGEGDFSEGGIVESLAEQWSMTPPLTKAYMSASLAATAAGYVMNRNQFPPILLLDWRPTFFRLQLWRPFTAFLNFGPLGLGYVMTGHFVWTYMSTLERLNYDKPYDFWMMIFFGCVTMVAGYTILKIPPRFLGHNLSTFLVYVWSRYHEGLEVNIMELFNAKAELLPWYFLAQTFLLEGEIPVLDLLGILFGHIYHHYKKANVLRTPQFIINWYRSDNAYSRKIRQKYKDISSDFEMQ